VAESPTRILRDLIRHEQNAAHDPLTPLIDQYMIERDTAPERLREITVPVADGIRPFGRLSPSSICGCKRAAMFRFLGIGGKKVITPQTQAIFDRGKWIHHQWGANFRDMEIVLGRDVFRVVAVEQSVSIDGLYIAGSLDILVMIRGVLWLIDFKSTNQWSFEAILRQHRPHEAHVRQLTTYEKARRVRRGGIFYDNKNDSRYMFFPVKFHEGEWAEVEEWTNKTLDKLEDESLPPIDEACKSGTFMYQRCPFSSLCFGDLSKGELERRVFRNFTSLDDYWERGNALVKAHDSET
jgi:hypothetical protein